MAHPEIAGRSRSNSILTATASVATSVLAAAVGFVVNILTARALGPTGRGEVAFVLQLSYLAAPVILLGADRALLRAERIGSARHFQWPNMRVSLMLATGLTAVMLPWGVMDDRRWLWQVGPIAFAGVTITVLKATGTSLRAPRTFLPVFLGYQTFVLVFSCVVAKTDSSSIAWWLAAYSLPGLGALVWVTAVTWRRGRVCTASEPLFDRLGVRLLPGSVASIVFTRGERLLLPIVTSTHELGLYMVVATATEAIAWVGQSMADLTAGRQPRDRSRADHLKPVLLSLTTGATMSLAAGVLLSSWLVPVFGARFESARTLIFPLCIAAGLLCVYRALVASLLASSTPTITTTIELVSAGVAVPIYLVGVEWSGASGAAWGSVAAYGAGIAIACKFGRRSLSPT